MLKQLIRLWQQLSKRRKAQFLILFLIMILSSFAEVLSIGATIPFLSVIASPEKLTNTETIKHFISALNISSKADLVFVFTITFIVAVILSGLCRLLLLWAQNRFSHAVGSDISINVYRKTLYQPYQAHISRNSSEIISGISDKVNSVVYNTILPSIILLSSSIIMVFILVAIVTINPTIALIAFVGFLAIYLIVIYFTKNKLSANSKRISVEQVQVIKSLQEGLGGIRDVLLDGTQEAFCQIYRNSDMPLRKAQASIQFIGNSPRYAIESMGMVLIALLAYWLTHSSQDTSIIIPTLGAFAIGAQRLLPALQQGYVNWVSMKGGQASLMDTLELLEQPMLNSKDSSADENFSFNNSIELKHLSFKYADYLPYVLDDINLIIGKGKKIGIIGTTGSGKSTLLDIMMSLLKPTSGQILVDGKPVEDKNYRDWQKIVAHVPQSIFLADASIAENIAFGTSKQNIDYEKIKKVSKLAQIDKTIEASDRGYNTLVGERGVRLSGGQRQRIGIARALYKNAKVIILDEATSALDNQTEQDVMQSIEQLSKDITIIIVAHRLTTLKNCDQVIELKDGKVSRIGNYKQLMNIE